MCFISLVPHSQPLPAPCRCPSFPVLLPSIPSSTCCALCCRAYLCSDGCCGGKPLLPAVALCCYACLPSPCGVMCDMVWFFYVDVCVAGLHLWHFWFSWETVLCRFTVTVAEHINLLCRCSLSVAESFSILLREDKDGTTEKKRQKAKTSKQAATLYPYAHPMWERRRQEEGRTCLVSHKPSPFQPPAFLSWLPFTPLHTKPSTHPPVS